VVASVGDTGLLALIVMNSTLLWPLNRWAMMKHARTENIGIVISAVLAAGAALVSVLMGKPLMVPSALVLGPLAGIAYAVGFILIIFYCLKIGPSGPTVTINNMGLIWPVLLDLGMFGGGQAIRTSTWAGLIITIIALVLMGRGRAARRGAAPMTKRWAWWALTGWMFSGISMGCQFLSSQYAPQAPFAFVVLMSLVSLAILTTITLVKRNGRFRKEEVIAGGLTGLMMVFGIPATIILLTRMSAAIVFPVTVAGPAILMLLIGHFILKERLSVAGWAASLAGIAGIVLLSVR
jgi:drug/metabolite transporter (DMT)-like permease